MRAFARADCESPAGTTRLRSLQPVLLSQGPKSRRYDCVIIGHRTESGRRTARLARVDAGGGASIRPVGDLVRRTAARPPSASTKSPMERKIGPHRIAKSQERGEKR